MELRSGHLGGFQFRQTTLLEVGLGQCELEILPIDCINYSTLVLFQTSRERHTSKGSKITKGPENQNDGPNWHALSDFLTSILLQNIKKNNGVPFWRKKFSEKSLTMAKKQNGGPLVSPGTVCYAEKRNNFYISVPCAKWSNLAP